MDYSLLSKFRGAWLGSIIAAHIKEKALINSQNLELTRNKQARKQALYSAEEKLLDLVQLQWRSLAIDWHREEQTEQLVQERSLSKLSINTIAFRLLPTILYYHDYWSYLVKFLQDQGKKENLTTKSKDLLLIWAFTIRLGLRGELDKQNFTQQIMTGVNLSNSSSHQYLSEIESLYKQGNNSQKLLENHSHEQDLTIILSLFYFFNNTHDLSLSTQQGLELDSSQQISVAALSGALSGAYNGLSTIPSQWRNSCRKEHYYQYVISKTEDIMGRWSGTEFTKEIKPALKIVTSVGILQPRRNLKIISQG